MRGPPRALDWRTMSGDKKFRIFVSWSKSPSKEIAAIVKELLTNVLDAVDVWVSDVDLVPGSRPMPAIHENLRSADAGVLVITRENQSNPWINYEAGVLAQGISDGANLVIPLLIDSTNSTDITGPLADLYNVAFTEDDLRKVVKSLALASGTDVPNALKRFTWAWDETEAKFLLAMAQAQVSVNGKKGRSDSEKIDEILERLRRLEGPAARLVPPPPEAYGPPDRVEPSPKAVRGAVTELREAMGALIDVDPELVGIEAEVGCLRLASPYSVFREARALGARVGQHYGVDVMVYPIPDATK